MKKLVAFLLLLGTLAFGAGSIVQTVNLNPGDSLLVNCPSSLSWTGPVTSRTVSCYASPTVTPTRTATSTRTPLPTRTATATPNPSSTATGTSVPTSTSLPSATSAVGLAPVDPAILGTCTAAIHDRYVVTGPDGNLYRTWHPQVVLIDPASPNLGTCTFAHEHGDDPTTSLANSSLPAFGYAAAVAGLTEPHEGYKVSVINQGVTNDEGSTALNSTRLVAHTGTGGAGRFDTQFHSAQFDLTAPDGHYVHLNGMANTGGVGSICSNPRQGKTVVTLPGTGCDISSLYEIWNMQFSVSVNGDPRVTAIFAPAVFDPITILNPSDPPGHRVIYYATNYFPFGPFFGCDREEYSGPVYWYNAGGVTTYLTDAYGVVGAGSIQQQISRNTDLGIRMSTQNQYQMKLHTSVCAPGLGTKN